jgi:hypothetical protein
VSAAAATRPPRDAIRSLAFVALIAFALAARVGVAAFQLNNLSSGPEATGTYLPRFTQIAEAEGRPYRDFDVEYPPVSLAAIEVVGTAEPNDTGVRLLWLSLALDAITVAALAFGWGRRAAVAYLVLTVPLLGFMYNTIDLLSVALATLSLSWVMKGHDRSGGVTMAAAVFAKVWPLALLPALVIGRRSKALWWAGGALAAGAVAWLWWGGLSGPVQVATQRGTPGWEYESTVGSLLWAFTSKPLHHVRDSTRIGTAPGWAKAVLVIAAVAGVAAVWRRAARRGSGELGLPAMAAVSILLLTAPVISHPYVIWLAPWAAIGVCERGVKWALLPMALMLVSGLLVVMNSTWPAGGVLWPLKAVLLLRNGLLFAVPVSWFLGREPREPREPAIGTEVAATAG